MAVTWKKLAYADDYITKATFTTKGDVLVTTGASTPIRLAVGTNTHVLTADSGEASGVKWAAAAGGGATLTVAETEVFNGTAPTSWTDLDINSTVGAQSTLVIIKVLSVDNIRSVAFRKDGDTDEFYFAYSSEKGRGLAGADLDLSVHLVFLVLTDSSGVIEWISQASAQTIVIDVMTYIK